jgi:multidrug resistance efflux pump
MSRRSDQLDRIEQALARLEVNLAAARAEVTASRIEVKDATSSAEAAHAGVQALADMLPAAAPAPNPPARRRTAAGTFAPESGEAAERLRKPGEGE